MRKLTPALTLLVLVGAVGACTALLRQAPPSAPNDVVRLADGVYFRHGDLEGHGHCNNGIIVFDDFVLVVDANFPSGAEACLADIRQHTDKPVRFVFDTHHHGDHAYGNSVWAAKGAVPVAQENVIGQMELYEPARWREAAENREDVKKLGRDGPMPPVVTFPRRMRIADSSRTVELLHFGTAHTRGDGFAYLPREKILFTGDAVVNGPYNYMGDGNTESWLQVLDALSELDVEVVAPGHGACGDRSLIADQRDYISGLREAVASGIHAGSTLEELQESVEVPERLQRYVGRMFRDQIAKIHSEMTGLELPLELEQLGFQADPATARGDGWTPPRKVVLASDRLAEHVPAFQKVAPDLEIVVARDTESVLREVEDADALIGGRPEAIQRGKKLRWVHSLSAGVEGYVGIGTSRTPGIDELVNSDIALTNGRRCYGVNIADQVMSYLVALTRQVKSSIEGKRVPEEGTSRWESIDPGRRWETELRGKTMLIVGVGGIGSQVAQRAKAFGLRVVGIDPGIDGPPPGVDALRQPSALHDVLPTADVLVLSCPLTRETRGLIGEKELSLMPRGSYLINVARGRIVDSDALAAALRSGQLAGAGLDVTEPEPLPDSSPLWSLENVIITPHNAGQSNGSARRIFLLVRENIRRFARGEPLLNVVNKTKGY
ncbi:MAG: NAD(P)-dependent oxidoreductase [Planctomycetota bacterium]|nr:NAD(P)-dependent oxidoreductase [Planctomycetota bacterium]